MAVLFTFGKLRPESFCKISFQSRLELLIKHYRIDSRGDVSVKYSFCRDTGVFCVIAWKFYAHQNFVHHRDNIVLTNYPFGYSQFMLGASGWNVHKSIYYSLKYSYKSTIIKMHPPLCLIRERNNKVEFWNDVLGMSKTFQLDCEDGIVFSSRPIAAHLVALKKPEPSHMGWASEQSFGWFIGDTSPYKDLKLVPGSSYILVDKERTTHKVSNRVFDWFLKKPSNSLHEGFRRLNREVNKLANTEKMDVALSGGRDSRAAAAIFANDTQRKVVFRTNYPPELEREIAANLIEKHNAFSCFDSEHLKAFDRSGELLWRAVTPTKATQSLHERAKRWTWLLEGLAPSVGLYSDCRLDSMFPIETNNNLSVSGAAGESAKAYYWSPNMVSGVFVKNIEKFLREINLPIEARIKEHPLTSPNKYNFADIRKVGRLIDYVSESQNFSAENGIRGYRFFDYWWLTERLGKASTIGYHLASNIVPLLTPEYTAYALQQPIRKRVKASALNEVIEMYMPQWGGIEFFDQLQSKAPREKLLYYRQDNILFEGKNADFFRDLINESHELETEFDMERVRNVFSSDIETGKKASLNQRAFGLVHRHYFGELCNEVSNKINLRLSGER